MSCIAVNIHEVKEKLIRLELVEPLHGKDGPVQQGKYRNVDTQEPMTDYHITERGFYEWVTFYKGRDILEVEKTANENSFRPSWTLIKDEVEESNDNLYYSKTLVFYHDIGRVNLVPFEGFTPTSRLDYWYLSIRRLPG